MLGKRRTPGGDTIFSVPSENPRGDIKMQSNAWAQLPPATTNRHHPIAGVKLQSSHLPFPCRKAECTHCTQLPRARGKELLLSSLLWTSTSLLTDKVEQNSFPAPTQTTSVWARPTTLVPTGLCELLDHQGAGKPIPGPRDSHHGAITPAQPRS